MKGLLLVIIVIFTFLTCLGLFLFRSYLGIEDVFSLVIYIVSILLILFVFLLCVPLFIKVQWITLLEKIHIKKESNKVKKNQDDKFKILKHKIKNTKKTIVGIIGNQDIIDSSFSNLTTKLYIEDRDYLYVYATEANKKWLNFRGLGKRVFDSVLYVTNTDLLKNEDFYEISSFIKNIGMIISVNIACIEDSSFNHDAICYSYKLNSRDFSDKERLKNDIEKLICNLKCAVVCEVENSSKYSYISQCISQFTKNFDDICNNLFNFVKKSKSKNIVSRITFISGGIYNNKIKGTFISPNTIYKKNSNSFYEYCCLFLVAICCLWVWSGYSAIKDKGGDSNKIEEKLTLNDFVEMDEIINNYKIINSDDELHSLWIQFKILPFIFWSNAFDAPSSYLSDKYVTQPFYRLVGALLESKLESLTMLNDFSDEDKDDLYNALKLYLILGKNKENDEIIFVQEHLLKLLADYNQEDVLRVFDKSLGANSNSKNFILDNRIIANSRNILIDRITSVLDVDKYYENLKQEAQKKYIPKSLSSLLKNDVSLVWESFEDLDGIYTKEAWKNFFSVKFNELDKELTKTLDWVIIDVEDQVDSSIMKKMKNKYFEEYIENWINFLNSISWKNTSSINESISQINKYTTRNNSCLINLLKVISNNTDLRELKNAVNKNYLQFPNKFKTLENNLDNLSKEFNDNDDLYESADIIADEFLLYKTFQPIITLLNDGSSEDRSNMSYDYALNIRQYMEKLVFLKRRMYLISSGNVPKEAKNYVLSSYNIANNNEFTEGFSFSTLLEEQIGDDFIPFSKAVFKSIFENSWNNISNPAKNYLNSLWYQQVYDVWQEDLSQKYPFVASDNEVSYSVIKKFFNPNKGIFYSFTNKYLKNFIDLSDEDYSYSNDKAINFTSSFYKSFDYCNELSRVVFLNSDGSMNFELQPLGGSSISESELIVDGVKIKYFNQVTSWKKITWPKSNTVKTTKLSWVNENTGLSHHISFNGDWGFLRLLETAKVEQLGDNLFLLTFTLEDGLILQYQLKTEYASGPLEFLKARNFNIPKKIVE